MSSGNDALIPPADLSDAQLLDAYQKSGGEPGDPFVETLLAEIERRNLDI